MLVTRGEVGVYGGVRCAVWGVLSGWGGEVGWRATRLVLSWGFAALRVTAVRADAVCCIIEEAKRGVARKLVPAGST